ncbi:hypothetical protein [Vibrio kanaloae]|uniref:hypothetical protein n=1 Tax=Vibrio kanaloae TaxID=170673 RepID=UPI001EFEE628|nr:hypothetical protein [Vibrio kanaloae]MCG9559851.1 hypothetical protein [Vibrio kanaloae]
MTILISFLSLIAAVASAFAVYQANNIARSARDFHINSILSNRELELLGLALEKLNIFDVWCKSGGSGEDINFSESKISEYENRDDAYFDIPKDVKILVVQAASHSERLDEILKQWEKGFIKKVGDSYQLEESLLQKKIAELRDIIAGGLKS